MTKKTLVAGVGMIPFTKPGKSESWDVMGAAATRAALRDASVDYANIQQAYVGYVYGDSTSGQSALYDVGVTGIPIINVNNNCSTGSTALFLARQAVASGTVDVALALGFEQMVPGALASVFKDRKPTMSKFHAVIAQLQERDPTAPGAAQLFGGAAREYQQKYGLKAETLAMISVKARRHAANNPLALFTEPVSVDQVLASPHLYGPLTRLQACPPTCGAAAAVIVSADYAKRKGLTGLVEIAGQALTTDRESTFADMSMIKIVGFDMAKDAACRVYEEAGAGPEDVQVVELHDCFTANELLSYESLGLAPVGGGERMVMDGDNTYGGKVVVNPSGGLLSKGHPLGATGLAQCYELVHQVRGTADKRQVEGVRNALQHNLGLGGACVVTMYRAV
ncbi:MAG TPA: lipid-transfer protein [Caulobacterales bacterium]|nr:lipid-transfer protein [Caulobacterales bacterium]